MQVMFKILFVIISWFVISFGWSTIYYYFNSLILKKQVEEKEAQKFGNYVYLFWTLQLIFGLFFFSGKNFSEEYFNTFMEIQMYFVMVSIVSFFFYNIRNK